MELLHAGYAMGYVQAWIGGGGGERQKHKISLGKGGCPLDPRGPVNNLDPRPFPAAGSAPGWVLENGAMGMGARPDTQLWTGCEFVTHDHLSGRTLTHLSLGTLTPLLGHTFWKK